MRLSSGRVFWNVAARGAYDDRAYVSRVDAYTLAAPKVVLLPRTIKINEDNNKDITAKSLSCWFRLVFPPLPFMLT